MIAIDIGGVQFLDRRYTEIPDPSPWSVFNKRENQRAAHGDMVTTGDPP